MTDMEKIPEEKDISQAAALLVGVYGEHAMDYATARVAMLKRERKPVEVEVWTQIAATILELSSPSLIGGNSH